MAVCFPFILTRSEKDICQTRRWTGLIVAAAPRGPGAALGAEAAACCHGEVWLLGGAEGAAEALSDGGVAAGLNAVVCVMLLLSEEN